jgi:4a-hydroxytetrahydrobiopterin dehydratase
MKPLSTYQCTATPASANPLTHTEQGALCAKVPDWRVAQVSGIDQLQRSFKFDDFVQAIAFANRISEIAESNDHHPTLLLSYGQVTVNWWSHSIAGLHHNDFVMAAKTDEIFNTR